MLTSRQPMFVWWGDELINLYNDAYRAIVGGKHPLALGQPASVVWREIWDQVGPRAASAMQQNEGTYDEALLLIMERERLPRGDLLHLLLQPGAQRRGRHRRHHLRQHRRHPAHHRRAPARAAARARGRGGARRAPCDDACARSARALATDPRDLPFALIYLHEPERRPDGAGRGRRARSPAIPPRRRRWTSTPPSPLAAGRRASHGNAASVVTEFVRPCRRRCPPAPGTGRRARRSPSRSRPPASPAAPACWSPGSIPTGCSTTTTAASSSWSPRRSRRRSANAQAYEDERKRAEALAELDRAKTAFFSNVSHEFRTPLTLMLGPLEDVLGRWSAGAAPGERALMQTAHRNGLRLLKLVNTLLDFSRIEAGRAQASYEPTDLAALTAELASSFRSAVRARRPALRRRLPAAARSRSTWTATCGRRSSSTSSPTPSSSPSTAGSRSRCARSTATAVLSCRQRHRHRHPRGRAAPAVRAVPPGGGMRGAAPTRAPASGSRWSRSWRGCTAARVTVESEVGRGSRFTVRDPARHRAPAGGPVGERRRRLRPRRRGREAYVEEALRWLPAAGDARPPPSRRGRPAAAGRSGRRGRARARVLVADDNADMREYVRPAARRALRRDPRRQRAGGAARRPRGDAATWS